VNQQGQTVPKCSITLRYNAPPPRAEASVAAQKPKYVAKEKEKEDKKGRDTQKNNGGKDNKQRKAYRDREEGGDDWAEEYDRRRH